jgi:hypothetical protein
MILRQLQTSPTEPITKYNEKTLTSVATTAVFATQFCKSADYLY